MLIQRLGFDELDPQAARLDYSLRRYYVDEFYSRHIPKLPVGSKILDVGGTRIGKRGQFDICRFQMNVTCLNISAEKKPDVVADAANMPFQDSVFDYVICSEVLEHVPDPRRVLAEIHRVLRPGGKLLATVPFLYWIHADPYDYGRYTDKFWLRQLREQGFDDISIEQQGRFGSVCADIFRHWILLSMPKTRFIARFWRCFWYVPNWYCTRSALQNERGREVSGDLNASFATGYGLVARKPSQ